jgi:predicted Zn finger-like uncharacterized protein
VNVSCPDCGSVFRVDPMKVAPDGVRAKCSICGGVMAVPGRDRRHSAPLSPFPTPIGMPAVAPSPPPADRLSGALDFADEPVAERSVETPPEPVADELTTTDAFSLSSAPRRLTPISEAPIIAPPTPVAPTPAVPTPVAATPAVAPTVAPPPVVRPALTPPVRSPTPRTTMPTAVPPATPRAGSPLAGLRTGPAGIAGIPRPPAAPVKPTPRASTPVAPTPAAPPRLTPANATPVAPTPIAPTPVAATPAPAAPLPTTPVSPTPLFSTPVAGSEVAPRRPVNPFLANDPSAKAKRLARALVSDMIAYLPQKREEGLRDGTLKQIFREEIKKSYEEYVDQIGREIAENTTHFQEALNDLLAGGQKIF